MMNLLTNKNVLTDAQLKTIYNAVNKIERKNEDIQYAIYQDQDMQQHLSIIDKQSTKSREDASNFMSEIYNNIFSVGSICSTRSRAWHERASVLEENGVPSSIIIDGVKVLVDYLTLTSVIGICFTRPISVMSQLSFYIDNGLCIK